MSTARANGAGSTRRSVRCAVYTRKSSEDGLEQDFNSLDAQREACAAYVLSQASEGWTLIDQRYDDGGLSGGTLARPALQRLLEDVKAGRIDIIVVYKVDRLTRSLLDFAKLVETFDTSDTSFVSITQSFNTTTSMGRLTLNMLLSFAQFEREVTAERIRDKIAASKAKGMWMGGIPPVGYRPDGRSLAVDDEQAELVREVYRRYRAIGHVRRLADSLIADGITSPRRVTAKGDAYGGISFSRGQLYAMLKNPVYAGDIAHKGKVYPGLHDAIIARADWDAVQAQLADHANGNHRTRIGSPALLAGLLHDGDGEPLVRVHARKGSRRYEYYVSKGLHHGTALPSHPIRIPAREIEQAVCRALAALLSDPLTLARRCEVTLAPSELAPLTQRCQVLGQASAKSDHERLKELVSSIAVHPERIELVLSPARLADLLGIVEPQRDWPALTHIVPLRLTRTGHTVRLVHDNGTAAGPAPDPTLTGLIAKAHGWWAVLAKGETTITELARSEAVTASYITRVVRLAFLSPAVVESVLAGRALAKLDGGALLATGAVPASWQEQAERLLPRQAG